MLHEVKKTTLEYLFSTPLLKTEVADADTLNAALLNDIRTISRESDSLGRANRKGWHSNTDLFARKEASFQKLCQHLLDGLTGMTRQTYKQMDLNRYEFVVEGWVNISPRGAYTVPHAHGGNIWSGCYYVQVPEKSEHGNSGDIEFIDPRVGMDRYAISPSKVFSDKAIVEPKAGTLLIFPSYLQHWVYPNDENADRVSVAFNAKLQFKVHH